MKISTNTINILKNFAKINPSIIIEEGNVLKTIAPGKEILSKSVVDTVFPKHFAIYNLDRFISTLTLFNEYSLKFEEKYVAISEENKYIKYYYADESTIKVKPPEKDIKVPSEDISFRLTEDNINTILKVVGVLGVPEIVVEGRDGNIYMTATDSKKTSTDAYSIQMEGKTNKVFRAVFKVDNFKLIPDDYDVVLSVKGLAYFVGPKAEYFIAIEEHSEF